MPNIVVTGKPGSGKGTQAELLAHKLGIPHISTGDIFREHMRNKTSLGLAITKSMNAGQYTSDSITNKVIQERLSRADVTNGFILDGYPRTVAQVKFLDSINVPVDIVVNLDINSEVALSRLLARAKEQDRGDDTETVIRSRFDTYMKTVPPVLELFTLNGVNVVNVPAVGKISTINDNIRNLVLDSKS